MFHLYTLPSTACTKNVTRSCIRISHRCVLDCPALPCSELRCWYLSLSTAEDVSASPSGASAAVLDFCPRILFADHRVVLLHQSHRLRCDPAMISVPSYCCYCCSVSDMDVISLLFNCYSEYSFHALYPLLVAASSTFLTLDAWSDAWSHHDPRSSQIPARQALMLVSVITFWAVISVEVLHPITSGMTWEDCDRCPDGFRGIFAAALTLFQQIVAGDSWGTISIPLVETAPWTAVLLFSILITISLGMLNLILAAAWQNGPSSWIYDVLTVSEVSIFV